MSIQNVSSATGAAEAEEVYVVLNCAREVLMVLLFEPSLKNTVAVLELLREFRVTLPAGTTRSSSWVTAGRKLVRRIGRWLRRLPVTASRSLPSQHGKANNP